jgi:hypothetical protein
MQRAGYETSLKEMERYLEECQYIIHFKSPKGEDGFMGILSFDIVEMQCDFMKRQGYELVSLGKLDKESVPELAKTLVDKFVRKMYGYVSEGKLMESSDCIG